MGLLEQMKRERERRGDGRFFGLYRGVVTNVNDPENLGRIRAKVHELLGDTDETDWAYPCVPFGGEGAGWLMLPKTNDAIWITFEAGTSRTIRSYSGRSASADCRIQSHIVERAISMPCRSNIRSNRCSGR